MTGAIFLFTISEKEIPIRPSSVVAETSASSEDTFCNSSDSKALINRDNSGDSGEPGSGLTS